MKCVSLCDTVSISNFSHPPEAGSRKLERPKDEKIFNCTTSKNTSEWNWLIKLSTPTNYHELKNRIKGA